jgi:hypothetical protein
LRVHFWCHVFFDLLPKERSSKCQGPIK